MRQNQNPHAGKRRVRREAAYLNKETLLFPRINDAGPLYACAVVYRWMITVTNP